MIPLKPFRGLLLEELLKSNYSFIDYEQLIPLASPIDNFINLIKPKALSSIDNNCFIDSIGDNKFVSALYDGVTSKTFPLQIPLKRCFFTPPDLITGYNNIFMVVAPYDESIIPVNVQQNNVVGDIFSKVGFTQIKFNVEDNSFNEIVPNPSFVISYMFVPKHWSAKAVACEVMKRCKHYTMNSNLMLKAMRELVVVSLGNFQRPMRACELKRKNFEHEEMLVLENFNFHVKDWYKHIDIYERNIDKDVALLTEQDIEKHASKKECPNSSLCNNLFLSQRVWKSKILYEDYIQNIYYKEEEGKEEEEEGKEEEEEHQVEVEDDHEKKLLNKIKKYFTENKHDISDTKLYQEIDFSNLIKKQKILTSDQLLTDDENYIGTSSDKICSLMEKEKNKIDWLDEELKKICQNEQK